MPQTRSAAIAAPLPARALALALSGALVGIGGLIAARPALGARLFGLPGAQEARPWLRALAARDFASAAALGLASRGPATGLASLAASLAIIPAADLALVAGRRGGRAWPSLALHGLSAAALAAIALGALGGGADQPGQPG